MESGDGGKGRPETGSGKKTKNFLPSGFRSPVFLFLLLTFFTVPLSSLDINRPVYGVSFGFTIYVAPFGIEQTYFTVQGMYRFPGAAAFSLRPSVSVLSSSSMFRIPFVLIFSGYAGEKDIILISGYLGGGLEVYNSGLHDTNSLLLTCGITLTAGSFYIDIPAARAYRSYNADSDIAVTAGFCFQL